MPEDMLKNILGNPETMNKIMGMMQSFDDTGSKEVTEKKNNNSISLPFGLDNPETLLKLGNIFQKINTEDDPRINLLSAIKPYLNQKRLQTADQAMQILKLSKMTSVLEELKIL